MNPCFALAPLEGRVFPDAIGTQKLAQDPGSSMCWRVCLSSRSACLACDDEAAGHSTSKQARAPLGCVSAVGDFFFSLCLTASSGDFVPMSWGRQHPPALTVGTGCLGWAANGEHQESQDRQMLSEIRSLRDQHFRFHRVSMRSWITKLHRGSVPYSCFSPLCFG